VGGKVRHLSMTTAAASIALLGVIAAAPLVYGANPRTTHSGGITLAKEYTGSETNKVYNRTAKAELEKVSVTQVNDHPSLVTGILVVYAPLEPEKSPFVGLLNRAELTFTVAHWNNAVCESGGCTVSYTGFVGKKGALTGYYSYYNSNGGTDGISVGVFSVKPKST
jgi:hypothetical protein